MAPDQQLNWGSINWIHEPEEDSGSSMRIGISTMNPYTEQPPHIHYGDEQLVYIISGNGRQWIDDKMTVLEPGTYFHIPAGIVHRQVNDSEEPLVKLLVSIPALQTISGRSQSHDNAKPDEDGAEDSKADTFSGIVHDLFLNELSRLRIPVTIFDAARKPIYHSREYPDFCCRTCLIDQSTENCEFLTSVKDSDEMANAYVCRHGLWVYTLPVITQNGTVLGYIKAGHVRTHVENQSEGYGAVSPNQTSEAVYSVPESTIKGITETVKSIERFIVDKYQTAEYELRHKRSLQKLSQAHGENISLKSTLRDTRTRAFNLQLNQHFLFNTLNALAGMAVTENAFTTYDGICDLADLLRYTLRTSEQFVTLEEELKYVKNYTSLQQIRFGGKLQVYYEVQEDLLGKVVPFNFLQPVVENCFVHGFRKRKASDSEAPMSIMVAADESGGGKAGADKLRITIADNGEGMDSDELADLRSRIENRSEDHGTLMVVQKLASLYADDFTYEVSSDGKGKGCKVEITMPV